MKRSLSSGMPSISKRVTACTVIMVFLISIYPTPRRGAASEEGRSLVILTLDPVGIEVDKTKRVSMSLRDAFIVDGRFDVISEITMENRLAGDPEQSKNLKSARDDFISGKDLLSSGRAGEAIEKFLLALDIHSHLNSEILRKEEMADVYFHAGIAMLELGKEEEAKGKFIEALLLSPGIGEDRSFSPVQERVLREARGELEAKTTRRVMTSKYASALAKRCGVEFLLWGFCGKEGEEFFIHIRLFRATGEVVISMDRTYPSFDEGVRVDKLMKLVEGCAAPLGLVPPPLPAVSGEGGDSVMEPVPPGPMDEEKEGSGRPFISPPDVEVSELEAEGKGEEKLHLNIEEIEAEVDPMAVERDLRRKEYRVVGGKRYRYGLPKPWYRKWWIWAIAGSVGLSLAIGIPLTNPRKVYIYGEDSYEIVFSP